MGKKRFQRHFRKIRGVESKGHPGYLFDETKNDYYYVGITEELSTKGIMNVPLEMNPDRFGKYKDKKAHIKPYASQENKREFGPRLKDWEFIGKDNSKVQKVIDDFYKGKVIDDYRPNKLKINKSNYVSKKSKKYKKKKGTSG